MIKKQELSLVIISGLLLVLFAIVQPSFAAFSLSVEPYEGGYDLRFGKAGTQDTKIVKEITIRVTTTIDKQYRVYQRLEKPLSTPEGVEIDRDNFKMYTLINSNTRGTLERIEEFPVMSSDTVLYTSDTAGTGDSFRVVYTLQPSIDQVAGSYHGRMLFYIIPIDSSQEQVVVTLNMYADLTNEGAVEISTEDGFKSIRISSRDLDNVTVPNPIVNISVKGNLGARYRLYQQLGDSLIKGSGGEQFDLSKVTYEIKDAKSGSVTKEGDLSDLRAKSLVYTSDDLGSSNEIAIEFQPTGEFVEQLTNIYTGVINYSIELDSVRTMVEPGFIDSVDVELEVEPIFRIVATSVSSEGEAIIQEGSAVLQFGELSYKIGVKESIVKIKVESNLDKPYLVTQKIMGILQNDEGDAIPEDFFTFKLKKEEETGGVLKFDKETVMDPDEDTTLFISNHDGDSDEFEITYRLRVTADTRSGDYNTGISYSLSEL